LGEVPEPISVRSENSFTDSNGGNDPSTANSLRLQYAPLQQLFTGLANNTVAPPSFSSKKESPPHFREGLNTNY
jgi:hypothetical protein